MDWQSDRLVTVSADRDGYVWTRIGGEWRENFVVLRLRRAATCVRWSADGLKFAVGGAEGIVSVCYYEAENDWWVCKHLKALDGSPVLALAWHPSGRLLAVVTLSGRVEILTTTLNNDAPPTVAGPSWLPSESFDESVGSLDYGCWIHAMAFSFSGDVLALAAHDGKVYVQDFSTGQQQAVVLPAGLPLRRLVFLAEGAVAVSGFGNSAPALVVRNQSSGEWTASGDLQPSRQKDAASSSAMAKAFGGALAKFRALDSQGIAISDKPTKPTDGSLHQAGISEIRLVRSALASTGHDGKLILWEVGTLLSRIGISSL